MTKFQIIQVKSQHDVIFVCYFKY